MTEPVDPTNPSANASPNAIGVTLGLLGDEWSLQIVRYALAGARRFGDWRSELDISDAVLSGRLRSLVAGGVLERVRYSEHPPRDEYRLTAAGLELWPVLLAVWSWERVHVPGQHDRLPEMVHRGCGLVAQPVLHCGGCHAPASWDDVALRLGPSGAFERSVPLGANRRRPGRFHETMEVIGSRWSSAVLGAAFLGATRFGEFQRMVGAAPAVLAERLARFVELGVLEAPAAGAAATTDGDPAGARSRYRLTAKGAALFDVVATLLRWGERWKGAREGPAVLASHGADGHLFLPELACSACGDVLDAPSVQVVPADRVGTEPRRHAG